MTAQSLANPKRAGPLKARWRRPTKLARIFEKHRLLNHPATPPPGKICLGSFQGVEFSSGAWIAATIAARLNDILQVLEQTGTKLGNTAVERKTDQYTIREIALDTAHFDGMHLTNNLETQGQKSFQSDVPNQSTKSQEIVQPKLI